MTDASHPGEILTGSGYQLIDLRKGSRMDGFDWNRVYMTQEGKPSFRSALHVRADGVGARPRKRGQLDQVED